MPQRRPGQHTPVLTPNPRRMLQPPPALRLAAAVGLDRLVEAQTVMELAAAAQPVVVVVARPPQAVAWHLRQLHLARQG